MPHSSHHASSEDRPEEISARLIDLANMVNLIHEALRATRDPESLYRIVAATMLSRRTLGLSRALLLRWDETARSFQVLAGLGTGDRAAHSLVRAAMDEAEKSLDVDSAKAGSGDLEEEQAVLSSGAEEIKPKKFWLSIFGMFEGRNLVGDQLGHGPLQEDDASTPESDFLPDLLARRNRCSTVTRAQLLASSVPARLKEFLTGNSIWAGFRTRKGTHLVLVGDKIFEPTPIDALDELHVNWFRGQVAIAVENAERFHDLEATNVTLREVDTLKSNFLATISHELRTPLTAISGFARLLAENKAGEVTPGQRQILERILVHSDRLSNVINDLIEIVEIDAGTALNISLEVFDPVNVLMDTLPKLEPRRASKSVLIEPVLTGPVPKIRADSKGMARIFYHLIDNAVKFSREKGKVRVEFEVSAGELAIHIIDSGIGIPPERLRSIFEAFYQVDGNLARVYEGMGVGLTLTQKIVQRTGGRISVRSELGTGSTFTVVYPLA